MAANKGLCPKFEEAFSVIAQKWNGLLILVLLDGEKRFSEIKELIPELSDKVLADKLKSLEKAQIIERHVSNDTPIKVKYLLTQKGRDFKPILDEVHKWALKW